MLRELVSRMAPALLVATLAIPGRAQAAAVGSLKDSFAGTSINSTLWTAVQNQGAASESGGTLNLVPNANTGASSVFVKSNSTYSLTGSMAAIRAATMPNGVGGNVDTQFSLLLDGNNYVQWFWQENTLYAFYAVAGVRTTVATLAYSPSAHAWWRIRENGGTTYWETSSDGASYTVQGSVSTSSLFPLSLLRYSIPFISRRSVPASPILARLPMPVSMSRRQAFLSSPHSSTPLVEPRLARAGISSCRIWAWSRKVVVHSIWRRMRAQVLLCSPFAARGLTR